MFYDLSHKTLLKYDQISFFRATFSFTNQFILGINKQPRTHKFRLVIIRANDVKDIAQTIEISEENFPNFNNFIPCTLFQSSQEVTFIAGIEADSSGREVKLSSLHVLYILKGNLLGNSFQIVKVRLFSMIGYSELFLENSLAMPNFKFVFIEERNLIFIVNSLMDRVCMLSMEQKDAVLVLRPSNSNVDDIKLPIAMDIETKTKGFIYFNPAVPFTQYPFLIFINSDGLFCFYHFIDIRENNNQKFLKMSVSLNEDGISHEIPQQVALNNSVNFIPNNGSNVEETIKQMLSESGGKKDKVEIDNSSAGKIMTRSRAAQVNSEKAGVANNNNQANNNNNNQFQRENFFNINPNIRPIQQTQSSLTFSSNSHTQNIVYSNINNINSNNNPISNHFPTNMQKNNQNSNTTSSLEPHNNKMPNFLTNNENTVRNSSLAINVSSHYNSSKQQNSFLQTNYQNYITPFNSDSEPKIQSIIYNTHLYQNEQKYVQNFISYGGVPFYNPVTLPPQQNYVYNSLQNYNNFNNSGSIGTNYTSLFVKKPSSVKKENVNNSNKIKQRISFNEFETSLENRAKLSLEYIKEFKESLYSIYNEQNQSPTFQNPFAEWLNKTQNPSFLLLDPKLNKFFFSDFFLFKFFTKNTKNIQEKNEKIFVDFLTSLMKNARKIENLKKKCKNFNRFQLAIKEIEEIFKKEKKKPRKAKNLVENKMKVGAIFTSPLFVTESNNLVEFDGKKNDYFFERKKENNKVDDSIEKCPDNKLIEEFLDKKVKRIDKINTQIQNLLNPEISTKEIQKENSKNKKIIDLFYCGNPKTNKILH